MPSGLSVSGDQNVNLSLKVDTDGAVTSLTVLNSTDPARESLIVNAVNQWRFSPATQNGQPLAVEGILDLSSPPAAPAPGPSVPVR